VYKVEVYARVRRAVQVDGMSIRQAAREFGLSRKTIRKMLQFSLPPGYERKKPVERPKLGPSLGLIDQILVDDQSQSQKQRHTAKRIWEARNMHADKRAEKIHGRGPMGKAIVFGLLDRETRKVRTRFVGTRRKHEVHKQIRENVAPGAEIDTDALKSYDGLDEYEHKVIDHAERYVDGTIHTNGLENFWSLLKRAIKGTYVSVEPFHLSRYFDEETFRYNERKDTDAGRFRKYLTR
jgi:hypothetical protein